MLTGQRSPDIYPLDRLNPTVHLPLTRESGLFLVDVSH